MLPSSVVEVRFRADSSAYNHELMDKLRDGIEVKGRKVRIRYAISCDMTEPLRTEIEKIAQDEWRPLRKLTEKGPVVGRKEWADVVFAPSKGSRKKGKAPDRYLALPRGSYSQMLSLIIAYNIISIMKRKALPQSWWKVRMKALRYWLIGVAGRLIRSGRQVYLRFTRMASTFTIYLEARRRLFEFAKGT